MFRRTDRENAKDRRNTEEMMLRKKQTVKGWRQKCSNSDGRKDRPRKDIDSRNTEKMERKTGREETERKTNREKDNMQEDKRTERARGDRRNVTRCFETKIAQFLQKIAKKLTL